MVRHCGKARITRQARSLQPPSLVVHQVHTKPRAHWIAALDSQLSPKARLSARVLGLPTPHRRGGAPGLNCTTRPRGEATTRASSSGLQGESKVGRKALLRFHSA